MGGAQPLAVTMNGGVALCVEVDPQRIRRRLETRLSRRAGRHLAGAVSRCEAARAERRPLSVGLCANAADVLPELRRMGFEADIAPTRLRPTTP